MRTELLVLLLGASLAVSACDAPSPSGDGEVHLRPHGDVLVAERVADVRETVTGDAMIFGERTAFDGHAGGSVIAMGRWVDLAGRVDGSVRAAGGTITLGTAVGRNVTMAGGTVTLGSGSVVAGNAYLAGGEVRIEGVVEGNVYVGANEVIVDGTVGGDVRIEAHALRLGPEARIEGDLRYRLDEGGVFRPEGTALVAGDTEALTPREPDEPGIGFLVGRVLAFLLAGGVIVALAPGTLAALVDPIEERPAASVGVGLVALLGVPLAVALMAVSVIGIPLALTTSVLFAMTWYFAPVAPSLWLGREMLGVGLGGRSDALKAFLVGGTVVALAGVAPWIGFPSHLAATAFGLGALVLMVGARSRPRHATGPG